MRELSSKIFRLIRVGIGIERPLRTRWLIQRKTARISYPCSELDWTNATDYGFWIPE